MKRTISQACFAHLDKSFTIAEKLKVTGISKIKNFKGKAKKTSLCRLETTA